MSPQPDPKSTKPACKPKHAKAFLQRYARRILGGYGGQLSPLFAATGQRLNIPWNGTKPHGYTLLGILYGQCKGVKGVTKDRQPSKQQQKKAVNSDAFLSSYEWRSLRMRVLVRCGAQCQCCGQSAKDGVVIHVDHIKPRRLFPQLALDESNLQVLCEVCNHGKGNWDQTNWSEPHTVELPPERYAPFWSKRVN